jgi:iron complex transport system substrate-binding protein
MKILIKKILITLLIITLMASFLTACGQGGQAQAKDAGTAAAESTVTSETAAGETAKAAATPAASAAFPITVTDALGTTMTIEKAPEAIVSLTLGSDEMLIGNSEIPGLIDKSRVISVTKYADDPEISNIAEETASIPNRFSNSAEPIIAAAPGLVLTDTWSDPAFVKQLRDAGITVYIFKTPCSLDDQKKTIMELAHILGAGNEGKRMVAWMEDKLAQVAVKLEKLDDSSRLTVMEYSEMYSSAGKGTNFDSVVTNAGLVNVVAKAGMEGWPEITKEMLIQMDPDIIVLPFMVL